MQWFPVLVQVALENFCCFNPNVQGGVNIENTYTLNLCISSWLLLLYSTNRYMVTALMGADLNSILKFQKLTDEHVQFLVYQILRGLKVRRRRFLCRWNTVYDGNLWCQGSKFWKFDSHCMRDLRQNFKREKSMQLQFYTNVFVNNCNLIQNLCL